MDKSKKHALIIVNGKYRDPEIPGLVSPGKNADGMFHVLTDPEICGFEEKNVETLRNHPMDTVRRKINDFFSDRGRDDFMLFYFAGHGFRDSQGRLYLAVEDTEKARVDVQSVSADFLLRQIGNCRAKQQVVILDCCNSGAFTEMTQGAPGSTVVVLTAGDMSEPAWEKNARSGKSDYSDFTGHIIEGLKTGKADRDGDCLVTVNELYEYVAERLASSGQTPLKRYPFGREEGKIIIAKNPRPYGTSLPESLLQGHYFISYSPEDGLSFAERLREAMARAGVPVWMDRADVREPGPPWDEQVAQALKTCAGLLFVATRQSVRERSDSRREWMRALRYKKALVPIRLEKELELPFRLEERKALDFSESDADPENPAFSACLEKLRDHLAWLDTPSGSLLLLKEQRADAQHDLRRARDDSHRMRILEDMERLDREIAERERIVNDPEAARRRVAQSIERGLERERRPAGDPLGECTIAACQKFINPPPDTVRSYFENRQVETRAAADFIRESGPGIMTVCGRGGIGKTALVCRVLHALESGSFPDDLGPFSLRGIVYLSAAGARKINFPNLFSDLCQLLSQKEAKVLDNIFRNPQMETEEKTTLLLDRFPVVREGGGENLPAGPVMVLLDNFENVVDIQTREISDPEMAQVLKTLLDHPSHAVKVIITSRVPPRDFAGRRPERQLPLPLDKGLASPYAEKVLRKLDVSGNLGLKDAPESLLQKARERTRGYPRALEALANILSADRDADLSEILSDTQDTLPENVVEVLVGEAYSRLDHFAKKIIQAMALYDRPVTPTALDYLLSPHLPGVDTAPVLNRLVNMRFARREANRYYLHPVDRAYALARIPDDPPEEREKPARETPRFTRKALYRRGADYFKQARLPRADWKTLRDLSPQLAEIDLRMAGKDYDTAARVLVDIGFDYLLTWGCYRLMIGLHERLRGKIEDSGLERYSIGNLGTAYYPTGKVHEAIECYGRALKLAREADNRQGEAAWLGNLGLCHADLGDTRKAIDYYEQALKIAREIGYRRGEAIQLGNLGLCHAALGDTRKAIDFHEQALKIHREIGYRRGEAADLGNLGLCHAALGDTRKAIDCLEQALKIDREIGYRQGEAIQLGNLGNCHAALGDTRKAIDCHEQALKIDREIGYRQGEAADLGYLGDAFMDLEDHEQAFKYVEESVRIADEIEFFQAQHEARYSLSIGHLFTDNLSSARKAIEAAISFDYPENSHMASAVAGIIAFKQNDISSARGFFEKALSLSEKLLAQTPEYFQALNARGLANAGLALCESDKGDETKARALARAAEQSFARAGHINSDPGAAARILRLLDTLAASDTTGILTRARQARQPR